MTDNGHKESFRGLTEVTDGWPGTESGQKNVEKELNEFRGAHRGLSEAIDDFQRLAGVTEKLSSRLSEVCLCLKGGCHFLTAEVHSE